MMAFLIVKKAVFGQRPLERLLRLNYLGNSFQITMIFANPNLILLV